MNIKTLALLGTTALTTVMSGQTHATKGEYFTDYARVIHVEPNYKYVTVQKPTRRCEIIQHQPTRSNGYRSNRHHDRSQRVRNTGNHNTGSAAFIGGVIGGAIGHHVTRNINGRSNVGATLAAAAIGSTLAHGAASNQLSTQRHNSHQISPQRHNRNGEYQRFHSSSKPRRGRDSSHRRHHQPRSYERCHTTTVSHEERRQDGYNVTYRYHGHTFNTKTSRDPGDRIAVRVQIKPH